MKLFESLYIFQRIRPQTMSHTMKGGQLCVIYYNLPFLCIFFWKSVPNIYLYLTRCNVKPRLFPLGETPWATCPATCVSNSHLLFVVKSQPEDGHFLVSPAFRAMDGTGWQSAMCFFRAGLVGATVSQVPHEYPQCTFTLGLLPLDLD